MAKLTQADVLRLPDGNHSFGDGLLLRVKGDSRTWSVRVQVNGKRLTRGLGSAKAMALKQARIEAAKLKLEIIAGDVRTKREKLPAAERKTLFKDVWQKAIEARAAVAMWKNEKHAAQWTSTVQTYALPELKNIDVADITRQDILRVLKPIWLTKPDTATRLRGRLEMIFDYCIREGIREKENPAKWKGLLAFDLPSRAKVRPVQHHEAPTLLELRACAPKLTETLSGKCILFGVLTATRVQEFVGAKWDEINFSKSVWLIPPERRKDGKPYPHRVPLSKQALWILHSIERKSEYVFYGTRGRTLTIWTPRMMLMRVVGRKVTMHGCRSTFRDWCAENSVDRVLAEKCLMHSTGTEVEQAYQRSDLLEQRRPVMQSWADAVCQDLDSGKCGLPASL